MHRRRFYHYFASIGNGLWLSNDTHSSHILEVVDIVAEKRKDGYEAREDNGEVPKRLYITLLHVVSFFLFDPTYVVLKREQACTNLVG